MKRTNYTLEITTQDDHQDKIKIIREDSTMEQNKKFSTARELAEYLLEGDQEALVAICLDCGEPGKYKLISTDGFANDVHAKIKGDALDGYYFASEIDDDERKELTPVLILYPIGTGDHK